MIEKSQSTDTNTKVNLMLGLPSKDFKAAIIKMLPQQLQILLKKIKKKKKGEEVSVKKYITLKCSLKLKKKKKK